MQSKTKLPKYFVTNVVYHVQYCYKKKQFVYTVSLSVTMIICYITFILLKYFYSDKKYLFKGSFLCETFFTIWYFLIDVQSFCFNICYAFNVASKNIYLKLKLFGIYPSVCIYITTCN